MARLDAPPSDPRPRSRLTPQVRRDVLLDVAALRLLVLASRPPEAATLVRIGDEATAALSLFQDRGWIAEPATYHREPPAPDGTRERKLRSANVRYTALSWLDGYECRPEEPGASRYNGYRRNRVARALLLEHRSGDRPWLVCVHGFGMGTPTVDLRGFRALHLHRDLGLNVAFPTLPLHGARRPGGRGRPLLPSAEALDTVHGLQQAVWDVRQLLIHLRSRSSQPIAVMGLSLGSCVAALVASLHDGIHAVTTMVPVADLASLMEDTAARYARTSDGETNLVTQVGPLLQPVSPLQLEPRVPLERRLIVAGTLDQFSPPSRQAVRLWEHWDRPELHWYHGGHISLFWARGVQDAIDSSIRRAGMA
jgi:hypothetical protein